MNPTLDRLSRLVTARPCVTLLVHLLIAVVLAAGAGRRAPVVEAAQRRDSRHPRQYLR